MVKIYKNATQYAAVFRNSAGVLLTNTKVTFNINGVYYNRTTNANGTARLNINLGSGSYILTACNLETEELYSNTITVLKSVNGSDITKYYRNATQYSATFLSSNGSLLTNASVTFNINGLYYTRTTNSNGVAKLNINLQSGEYIITSTYNSYRFPIRLKSNQLNLQVH